MPNFAKACIDRLFSWFESFVSSEDSDSLNVRPLFWLFISGAFLVFSVLVMDLVFTFSDPSDGWHGTFGDFFGGVVNPILTFLTFFGLLITIVLQKAELRETRKELAKSASALDEQVKQFARQGNVAGFYKLVDNHMSIVSSIDLVNKDGVRTFGRDCIRVFRNRLEQKFRDKVQFGPDKNFQSIFKEDAKNPEAVKRVFKSFWEGDGEELQPYMASVRITLSYLESQLSYDSHFVRMYRALFTSSELALIFYYALVVDDEELSRQLSVTSFCINLDPSFLLLTEHNSWLSECRIPTP